MITIIGIFTFTEAKYKEEFLEALAKLVEYTKANEPGTTNYTFLEVADNPLELTAVEEWKDQAALDIHLGSDAIKEFLATLGPMMEAKNVTAVQKTSNTPMVVGFGPR